MKVLSFLPLLLLSTLSIQARTSNSLPTAAPGVPVAPSVAPRVYGFTGYANGQELIAPNSNGGINYIYNAEPYLYFSYSGQTSSFESVTISIVSGDNVQLFGPTDDAQNVWQLKMTPNEDGVIPATTSCTIQVSTAYQTYYYNLQLSSY